MTMVSDTAAEVEQGTVPEVEVVTPVEAEPTETTVAEIVSPDEATETVDPLASFTPAQLKAHPLIKKEIEWAEQRKEESFRQRREQEQADAKANAEAYRYRQEMEEASEVERGVVYQSLQQILGRTLDPDLYPDAQHRLAEYAPLLNETARQVHRALQMRNDRTYTDAANNYMRQVFPNYATPQELGQNFDRALHAQDFDGRFYALAEIIKDAAVKAALPAARQKFAAELKKQADDELALENKRRSEKAATANTRATTVSARLGSSGHSFATKSAASAARQRGEIDLPTFRAIWSSDLPDY